MKSGMHLCFCRLRRKRGGGWDAVGSGGEGLWGKWASERGKPLKRGNGAHKFGKRGKPVDRKVDDVEDDEI
ncbi:hypothetical protein HanIR_Chr08g0377251 [Helianthus annuus]|nr:hypothetical protein HanIR_Chr08g0377251 [Helianthus annuus]